MPIPDGGGPDTSPNLVEDRRVYTQDDLSRLPIIRLTVTDLAGLKKVHDNVPDATVGTLFQEGTFAQELGADAKNATLQLRGSTSRLTTQKSYRIKFTAGAGAWRGQRAVNLLKNPYDLTRVRNYLAFEYFKTIPDLTSLRHQFVQVFLNKEDLGLYEWFEEMDERFLAAHGLDPNGILYKANRFAWLPLPPDAFTNPTAAESLEAKGKTTDPAKLQKVLEAIADDEQPIDGILDRYFSRDNYETWLAVNILFSNWDTITRNFYLYSPMGSERWYILPWDYNEAFGAADQPDYPPRPRTRCAPANWWSEKLHRRFLREPGNVASLERRLKALLDGPVSDANTKRIADAVHPRVRSFIERLPDLEYLPVPLGVPNAARPGLFEAEYARLATVVSSTFAEYRKTVQWPMPMWLGTPEQMGATLELEWDRSFDLQGDPLAYDVRVARAPEFGAGDVVFEMNGVEAHQLTIPAPPPGRYFLQVIARDGSAPADHWQLPFDVYVDPKDREYPGVLAFEVK